MKNKNILLTIVAIACIVGGYFFYDKHLGPPTVCVTNKSNELVWAVIGYPGGRIGISDIHPNKTKTIRLHGINSESSISVEVNGAFIKNFGYVGPYPSKTNITIVKRDNKFALE